MAGSTLRLRPQWAPVRAYATQHRVVRPVTISARSLNVARAVVMPGLRRQNLRHSRHQLVTRAVAAPELGTPDAALGAVGHSLGLAARL